MNDLITAELITANEYEDRSVSINNPEKMKSMMDFAVMMSQGVATVPAHLQGSPSDCLAIAMQATQWGMNPFAVAQKTHFVNGVLGYEAQLVNAVLSSSTAIAGRPKYKYSDGWEALAGKVRMKQNSNNRPVPEQTWEAADEIKLWVQVGCILNGETDVTWGQKIFLANVTIRNSPLWVTAPQQQLSYLALKYWSRLYTPDVILGVYDKESLEQPIERKERIINHGENATAQVAINATAGDLNALLSDTANEPQKSPESQQVAQEEVIQQSVTKFEEIRGYIENVDDEKSYSSVVTLYNDAVKSNLCTNEEFSKLFDAMKTALAKIQAQQQNRA